LAETEPITLSAAVDLHVHFREPSPQNHAETIASGSRAALLGGFVMACDMPNNPGHPTWSAARLEEKHAIIYDTSHIPMATYAGSQPESDNIGSFAEMEPYSIGLKLYMGKTTGNENSYKAKDFEEIIAQWHKVAPDKPIMVHRGNADLEEIIYEVSKKRGHHLHICHVNNPNEVVIVKRAKAEKLPVTCGICPHHLFLTSHDEFTRGSFAMMMPELARQIDSEQLWRQLVDGDIDAVESDHAPHSKEKKWEAEKNDGDCFGVPSIEIVMPLLLRQLKKGRLSSDRLEEVTSRKPAEIVGVKLNPSTQATWLMEDFRFEDEENLQTGAKWNPYLGMLAVGRLANLNTTAGHLVKDGEVSGVLPGKVISKRGTEI
jgi:dihydroorotase